MREWTIVSGMEARACCVCLAWASFGLRDVHVKTNGCFFSLSVQHDCYPRLHVCISCRSQRKHARHIASVRDMLHIESSRRFWRVCVNTRRAHMRIRALASAGRVHVNLTVVLDMYAHFWFIGCRGNAAHAKFGRRFRHAPILAVCQGGIKYFTPFARRTSYAKC